MDPRSDAFRQLLDDIYDEVGVRLNASRFVHGDDFRTATLDACDEICGDAKAENYESECLSKWFVLLLEADRRSTLNIQWNGDEIHVDIKMRIAWAGDNELVRVKNYVPLIQMMLSHFTEAKPKLTRPETHDVVTPLLRQLGNMATDIYQSDTCRDIAALYGVGMLLQGFQVLAKDPELLLCPCTRSAWGTIVVVLQDTLFRTGYFDRVLKCNRREWQFFVGYQRKFTLEDWADLEYAYRPEMIDYNEDWDLIRVMSRFYLNAADFSANEAYEVWIQHYDDYYDREATVTMVRAWFELDWLKRRDDLREKFHQEMCDADPFCGSTPMDFFFRLRLAFREGRIENYHKLMSTVNLDTFLKPAHKWEPGYLLDPNWLVRFYLLKAQVAFAEYDSNGAWALLAKARNVKFPKTFKLWPRIKYEMERVEALKMCMTCLRVSGSEFGVCGGCQERFYCSKTCQAEDWRNRGHRSKCKRENATKK